MVEQPYFTDESLISGSTLKLKIASSYKLKPLVKNTPLDLVIEILNLLNITLWPGEDVPHIQEFIDKHPDLVEEQKN